ncbi:hypothetical protein [Streptomyces sp. SID3343]|uniref:hypothetical protein n=1 Tax=Streptomyces sp. SID3343 TaxID=2690260 RepID=UPI00136F933F|nr:hypothetical protein [Streptomyces sp. SID3343]MYV99186.1 hypothetical protein [Streptomyces sp. SID3343]
MPLLPRHEAYRIGEYHRYHRELDETCAFDWKAFEESSNDEYHVWFVYRRLIKVRKQTDTVVRFDGRITSGYKPHSDAYDVSLDRTNLGEEDVRGSFADPLAPDSARWTRSTARSTEGRRSGGR